VHYQKQSSHKGGSEGCRKETEKSKTLKQTTLRLAPLKGVKSLDVGERENGGGSRYIVTEGSRTKSQNLGGQVITGYGQLKFPVGVLLSG